MSSTLIKTIITIVILVVAAVGAVQLVWTRPVPPQITPAQKSTTIRVIEAKKQSLQMEVRSQGTVLPQIQSELIPEVNGRVKWISSSLAPGGFFNQGDVLVTLDDTDHRAQVQLSRARLERADAEFEHASFELRRMQTLVRDRLTSQSSLETSLRSQRIARATKTEARISLEQAQRDLARTQLKAPYTGFVRTKRIDVGQYVQKGMTIASIYDSQSVEIRLPVMDSQLAYLDLPMGYRGELSTQQAPVVILSTSYAGQKYQWLGTVARTESEIDSKSRMTTLVARVQNDPSGEQPPLQIGLFVSAIIKGRDIDNIFRLPRAAIRNQNQVLIVDQNNQLRFRQVDVLRFEKDNIIISSGLNDGDKINISPIQSVTDGMQVTPNIMAAAEKG